MDPNTRFRVTASGRITPDPLRTHVSWVALGFGRTLLGEVTSTFRDETGSLRLRVKHFNGEPWPAAPLLAQVDVLERD